MQSGGKASVGAIVLMLAALALFGVYGYAHLSPWAASWDEVDFALALDRFDLLAMQPHAPGYPYFILGGRAMRALFGQPVQALGLWNLLLTLSSAYPIFALARRWVGALFAALTTILVLTLPMNATLATGAMSEGAALALLWWYLWSLAEASERRTTLSWTGAAFAFGLLMGTRLSYAPFGLGLAILWLAECGFGGRQRGLVRAAEEKWNAEDKKEQRASAEQRDKAKVQHIPAKRHLAAGGRSRRIAKLTAWLAIAAAFQLLWLGGLAIAEGGFGGMLSLIEAFAAGHFSEWGGGVASVSMPFGDRLLQFVGDNVLWTGAFARLPALLALAAALLGLAVALRGQEPGAPPHERARPPGRLLRRLALSGPAALLALPAGAYGAWALLGQNIAKPRHAAPLAALLAFALAAYALRACARRPRGAPQIAAAVLALALAADQTAAAATLVGRQATERPAVYRLADYVSGMPADHAVLYTWEEERVLGYLNVPIETRPIFTYAYFLAEVQADPGARILLTSSVLRGFREQANIPDSRVKKLASFRSDSRLDPVYGNIDLYEWIRSY